MRTLLVLSILVSFSFFTRLGFKTTYLDTWDAVDFALALTDYNMERQKPHPPGYPIFILLARLFYRFTRDDIYTFMLLNATFSALTIILLFCLAHKMYGKKSAVLTSLLFILNPISWLTSERILSDTVGMFFLTLFILLIYLAGTYRRYMANLAGMTMGILLGIRLSYFPAIFMLAWYLWGINKRDKRERKNNGLNGFISYRKDILYPITIFVLTVTLWLSIQVYISGWDSFFISMTSFFSGHMLIWGDTIITKYNILDRTIALLKGILIDVFGIKTVTGDISLLIVVIGFVGYFKERQDIFNNKFLFFYSLPYLLWIFFGQNLKDTRHLLPLVIPILLIASKGIYAFTLPFGLNGILKIHRKPTPLGLILAVTLVISTFFTSYTIVKTNCYEKSTLLQAVEYIKDSYKPEETIIFGWETKRLFDYYAPQFIVAREEFPAIEEIIATRFYGKPKIAIFISDMLEYWNKSGYNISVSKGMYVFPLPLGGSINMKKIKRFKSNPLAGKRYKELDIYESRMLDNIT